MDKTDKIFSAIEQSDISLMFIDKSGNIEYINQGFTTISGYSSEDILGKSIKLLISDELNDNFYQKIWETVTSGNSWQGEIKLRKKNNEIIWEQIKIYPILDEIGQISHYVKIGEDVTNQRHMLDALIRSYDFIESIMNNINSIYVIDKDKKFLQINLIFLKTTGYKAGEIINKDFRTVFTEDCQESLGKEFDRVITEKIYTSNFEAVMINKDSSERIVSMNFAPLIQDDGVVYVVGSLHDITEEKETTEKLRQKNIDMERDLHYAQMIISKLLPTSILEKEFVKIQYRYKPLEAIGGDFFSFVDINDNQLGVFIGDVAGHGVSAALFLSLVKSETERISQNYSLKPALFINELNNHLQNSMTSYFLTALYSIFTKDGENVKFTFAKGGHPAPIYYSKKRNSFTYLKSKGKPISLFKDVHYEETTVFLEKGDRIFLYTDGLSELTKSKIEFINEEEFLDLMRRSNDDDDLNKTLDLVIVNAQKYINDTIIDDDVVLIGFEII